MPAAPACRGVTVCDDVRDALDERVLPRDGEELRDLAPPWASPRARESRSAAIPKITKAIPFRHLKTMTAMKPPEIRPPSFVLSGSAHWAMIGGRAILPVCGRQGLDSRVRNRRQHEAPGARARSRFSRSPLLRLRRRPPVLRTIARRTTSCGTPSAARLRSAGSVPGRASSRWTEDCYDGAVTRPDQLPTKVQPPGHDNPQTGPFYVEGAEPGDTVVDPHREARARPRLRDLLVLSRASER